MSKRRRKNKARGLGVHENEDGSTTTIVEVNGMIIETRVRPNPGLGEAKKQVVSRAMVAGPPAGKHGGLDEILEKGVAPAARTNVIPGEKPGVIYDQGTGLEFTTRGDLDAYYKQHNLVDMSGREGARRMAAPSFAEKPKSEGSQHVQAFDPNGMPPPGKLSEKTIMTPEARQRVFGGAAIKIGRRFK